MKNLKKKPLVVYLLYYPILEKTLKYFVRNYKKYNSGYDHELLICFKGFDSNSANIWKKKILIKFNFFKDYDNRNDFDI